MATVIKLSDYVNGTTGSVEMKTFVENYWGSEAEEKIFPIPYWKLNQLINISPSEQAAFHVTDINNRTLVDGEWISYNDDFDELLEDANVPHEYYFVMDESIFQDMRAEFPFNAKLNQVVFWGRIGKATADGNDYVAFLLAAKTEIFPPGTGGGGATTGIRLPPGGDA